MAPKARRAKGDGSLYQRKDGMWIGIVDLPADAAGKRRRRTVSSLKYDTAMQKLRALRREVEDGLVPVTAATTVAVWLDYWLTDIVSKTVGPGTLATYRSTVKRQIIPAIGNKRLAKLTPADIRAMNNTVATNHSTRTAEATFNTLSGALRAAKREGLIRENQCERVDRPKALSASRGALSADQVMQLFAYLAHDPAPRTSRMATALLTGARQAECLGLEWDRVDFDRKLIDISWQLKRLKLNKAVRPAGEVYPREAFDVRRDYNFRPIWRGVCLVPPKTESSRRIVPMIPPLEAALRQHRDHASGTGLVWTRADGSPIVPADDTSAWRDTLVASGIYDEGDDVPTLHAARHTLATLLQDADVPEPVRMAIIGHSTATAQRIYAHVDTTLTRRALGQLPFGDTLGGV